ncbi:hypothetical protein JIN85_19020 [Luteolibacter pohnpeiensis]|uniref:Uncharacterized protein n=1 Tax=Luteolibacter pohnpeiensis TaxID=454153 RepID=A0A934S862_9BACT|nr:hypothetical protein [Luteolibacter pohnpeiensis]MBK1884516.1 hypothetical protein [Luteolibacter pohnpeiensis]
MAFDVMQKMGIQNSIIPNSLGGRLTGAKIADGLLGRSCPAKFGCALLAGMLCLGLLLGPRFWIQPQDSLGIGQAVTDISQVAIVSVVSVVALIAVAIGILRGERLWAMATMLLIAGVTILKILA